MSGPDLDRDLETIGRRLSPRLGQAHDRVVDRATASARGRAHHPQPPRAPSRIGGAVLTLAVTAAFGTLLAVGVATRPDRGGAPVTRGPSVAMATTTPGLPAGTDSPGGEATPPPAGDPVATAPAVTAVTPTRPGPAATTPPAPRDPVFIMPAPTAPPGQPPPTAAATASPSTEATPGGSPAPSQTAQPTPASSPRIAASPTAPAHQRVVLSEKANGTKVTVHQGDVVEVDLSAPQGGWHWTVPSSTDGTVVKHGSGSSNADGSATAAFSTTGKNGTAAIQASKVPACATATPRCLPPQRIDFKVTIVVVP